MRVSARRGASALSAVFLGAMTLTACGSDGGDSNAASGPVECAVSPSEKEMTDARKKLAGETITFVVDRSPGGGYDQYARLVAPYMAEALDATIVVENQEGAGGLVAMNRLASRKATGLDIATFNAPGLIPATIADYEGVQFVPAELTWIGRMAGEPDVIVVREDSPFKTFEELMAGKDVSFGASGPGSADYVTPTVLIDVLGADAEVIPGYDGSSEIELGLIRGDVDAMSGTLDSRVPALDNGSTRALAVISEERLEQLPDVPTIFELELDAEQNEVLEAHIAIKDIGRPVVAPPEMDPAMTAVLRQAFQEAVEDPELLAKSKDMERPIGFLSGEEQCELAQKILDAPASYQTMLKEAFRGGKLED